jgi:hypothetical protein
MEHNTAPKLVRHVHLYGAGHLASATRLELARLGIHRDTEYQLPPLLPPLLIACSDCEKDSSFPEVARRAVENRSPMLFAHLAGHVVRIGPLVEPREACFSRVHDRREAGYSSYMAGGQHSEPGIALGVAEADLRTGLSARLGAVLVAAQALNFLQGARNQCVLDTLVEINPLTMESKAYRVVKLRQ